MTKHANHLIHETSPYLLQHAHNPVNWYPWAEEALQKAKDENKPILVSIGYAACHWCHVMERESFEDEATAGIMNDHFINIKIDREERPDLDHIYMDAVQAMTGSGGWPLNVFLTPDTKPFYGGTYFPPKRAFNRASWQEVLLGVIKAFNERRHEIDAQAENLTEHLIQSNSFGLHKDTEQEQLFSKDKADEAFQNIMKSADREWGGFGRAPKFPQTFTIQFLLRYHHGTGNQEALQQALLSLDKMIEGGIYDQVGGGFARYSTDTEWLVPHFEKMLYDNALLISVLSEAYQLTKKDRYKEVIEETMNFVQRELLHPQKGFYAALDADSEGEEGRFYVWNINEVNELLGEEAAVFCKYFDVTEKGNWEKKNICRVKIPPKQFAEQNGIAEKELNALLKNGKEKLLQARDIRVRPLLDDKIILGWNALMNTACSKAYVATGKEEYRQLAIDNIHFLWQRFKLEDTWEFFHTWKDGQAKYPAFLDDYAFFIEALIHLQEITADQNWLDKARQLADHVVKNFSEPETGFFYYTKMGQEDVIVRKKEIYDGAVPSGNSIMAYNLHRLSILLDRPEWQDRSIIMLSSVGKTAYRYPTSFGIWSCLLQEIATGTFEIAVIGKEHTQLMKELYHIYIPHKVFVAAETPVQESPLLSNKPLTGNTLIYLCKGYVCQQPVDSIERFMLLINREKIAD
ncbi:MAG: thioredoxin domain-containing protein [Chitinophagaceae bacterium]|nr:thioredoxin domain-containing protein [Chitinophagaceae bacterium]